MSAAKKFYKKTDKDSDGVLMFTKFLEVFSKDIEGLVCVIYPRSIEKRVIQKTAFIFGNIF